MGYVALAGELLCFNRLKDGFLQDSRVGYQLLLRSES
jgi:hypothetical protein